MNECGYNCFTCPFDDCIEDEMRLSDYESEIKIDRLLGNYDDALTTVRARYYALHRTEIRIKQKHYYMKKKM